MELDAVKSVDSLRDGCASSNRKLLRELREGDHAQELLNVSLGDSELGRLSDLAFVEDFDTDNVLLHPRFAVAKGKPDGSVKIRAVDHFSWSPHHEKEDSVNGYTFPAEKFKHETLDHLGATMALFVAIVQVLCSFSGRPRLVFVFFMISGHPWALESRYRRRVPPHPCAPRSSMGLRCRFRRCVKGFCSRCLRVFSCSRCPFSGGVRLSHGVPLRGHRLGARLGTHWCSSGSLGLRFAVLAAAPLR